MVKKKRVRKTSSVQEGFVNCETNIWWRIIGNLPTSLGIFIGIFGTVNVALLLFDSFSNTLIFGVSLPIAVIVTGLANRLFLPMSKSSLTERRIFDVLAILFVIGWGIFNIRYTAQTVYLYRDPGLYNVTARWLMDHDDIKIPATNPFGDNDNLYATSNAGINILPENQQRLYTHGQRLLPTFSAIVGRIYQEAAALKINVLFGASAILALYGFMRLFIKSSWAFFFSVIFSLCLPMIYFSRDMYSEPLSMLLFFTSLSLLYYAMTSRLGKNKYIWLLVGFITGSVTLTRIDAYLGVAGVLIALIAFVFSKRRGTNERMKVVGYFLMGTLISSTVAWLDLTLLGTAYYRFQKKFIFPQIYLIIFIVFALFVFYVLVKKTKLDPYRVYGKLNKGLFAGVAVLLLICSITFLFARPMLIQNQSYYEVQKIAGTESIVLQKEKTEKSIRYENGERVILWPTWYLGLGLCLLALIGLFIVTAKVVKDREMLYLLPLYVSFIMVCLLYMHKPSITPDHIWATRRMLPLVLPGVVFFAGYAFDHFFTKISKSSFVSLVLAFMLLVYFITGVTSTTGFYLKEREDQDMLTQVNQFCNRLPKNSAVLLIGNLGLVGTQTIHSYCQVPTARFVGNREPRDDEFVDFYNKAAAQGYVPVVAAFYEDRPLFVDGSRVRDLERVQYKNIEKVFETNPRKMVSGNKQITYGLLSNNGTVEVD